MVEGGEPVWGEIRKGEGTTKTIKVEKYRQKTVGKKREDIRLKKYNSERLGF